MPVFSRMKNDVLVLTVDGDYTSNELRRVGFRAFEAHDARDPLPVLFDLSGAAGLTRKSEDELVAAGAFFGAYRDRIQRLAIVATPEAFEHFGEASSFADEASLELRACHSHAEAMAWLAERP